jgi:hypothetical protein
MRRLSRMRAVVSLAWLLIGGFSCGAIPARAQSAPIRVVVLKFDGLPPSLVDRYVNTIDPRTGRSIVPWIKRLFYEGGVRFTNYYSRGMSLSMPSWAMTDSGQHGVIKGNWEVDRHTGEPEDYLNMFDLHVEAMRERRAYPRSVEALDAAGIPLLSDAFRFEERRTGIQLLRRGTMFVDFLDVGLQPVRGNLKARLADLLSGTDWEVAFDIATREDMVRAIRDPKYRYVDYYNVYVDHLLHRDNDEQQLIRALRQADLAIGEAYEAVVASGAADRTMLAVVSDHGITYDESGRFSHGLNLLPYLTSREFGALNVLSRRGHLPEFTFQGSIFKPLPPLSVVTAARESYYLDRRREQAICAIDNDGNERVQIHLRSPELNRLQMLRHALTRREVEGHQREAVEQAALQILERNREAWRREALEIREELSALVALRVRYGEEIRELARVNEKRRELAKKKLPLPSGPPLAPFESASALNTIDRVKDMAQRERELRAAVWRYEQLAKGYERYRVSLELRASIRTGEALEAARDEALFGDRDLGANLSLADLRAYPVGMRDIVLDETGRLDDTRSFVTVDYLKAFGVLRVANTVYDEFASRPVDFSVVRLPLDETRRAAIGAGLLEPADADEVTSALLLYRSDTEQLVLFAKSRPGCEPSISLLPAVVTQQPGPGGAITIARTGWTDGVPLGLYRDPRLASGAEDRAAWLTAFHTEREWLDAVHRTKLGLGVVGLSEVFSRDYVDAFESAMARDKTPEERLARRFELRRRKAMETDLLLHASAHWNFSVKDFNAGGNHGGFSRQSMHAVLWMTGGSATRIPKGPLLVERACDGLDFAPTILEAAGVTSSGRLPETLVTGGFRPFPGRVAYEALGRNRPRSGELPASEP